MLYNRKLQGNFIGLWIQCSPSSIKTLCMPNIFALVLALARSFWGTLYLNYWTKELQCKHEICLKLTFLQQYGLHLFVGACFFWQSSFKKHYSSKQCHGAFNRTNVLYSIINDCELCLHLFFYKVLKFYINITTTKSIHVVCISSRSEFKWLPIISFVILCSTLCLTTHPNVVAFKPLQR